MNFNSTPFLDLTKSFELNLQKANILNIPKLATRLAVDKSGSMHEEFQCGWVDHSILLFLVAAMKFDDDGRLEVGFFNNDLHCVRDMTEADVYSKVPFTQAVNQRAEGGTSYAPVIEGMADYRKGLVGRLFNKVNKTCDSYIGMITDGDCSDFGHFAAELKKVTGSFVQLIAIGNQVTLGPLRQLEQELDHFNVMHLSDPYKVTHDDFYQQLCNPTFKKWLETYGSK